VARPISLHEQNLAIFGQSSKHTLMSCGLCLVLRASRTVEELIQEEIMLTILVLGASWTVEEVIQEEIMYVDYV
jgi:hypothetical protein